VARIKILLVFALSLAACLVSYSSMPLKPQQKTRPPLRLDECDTLFRVTLYPQGNTLRLRWEPLSGVTDWMIFRATNANLSDLQQVATVHDSSTWLESADFLATHPRAYYRIAAHWDQGTSTNYQVIENFDGMFLLQTYSAAQDSDPDAWRPLQDGAYNTSGRCIELYGNTWKREQITDTARLHAGSIWRVAAKSMRVGTMQAFGMADSANEMWYPLWGTRMQQSEAWNNTYQGWYPDSQWVLLDLPVGDDWMGRFGYYPLVRQLLFANDNDDSGAAGVLRIDEIRDVTGSISLPPVARFHWQITNRPSVDTMEVTFCSMGCDPEGPLYREFWSFGDGTSAYTTNPVHRYRSHGSYVVTLSVIDTSDRADYITQQVSDTSYTASRHISTLWGGDVMIARRYEDNGGVIDTYGPDSIFGRIQPLLQSVDLAMANLECPFTNSNRHHPTKSIYFKGRPQYTEALKFAGFEFLALANNHSMDYMEQGMIDTKHLLDSLQILSTGTGGNDEVARQPVFFSQNGLCVAILSYCNRDGSADNEQPFMGAGPAKPGFAMWDRVSIEQTIPAARQVADVVIVQVHSGIEYATEPPTLQQRMQQDVDDEDQPPLITSLLPDTGDVALRKYAIDMGADLVINHHPHVIQGCQVYDGHVIAHSMGNFAFDQQLPETFVSMAIQAQLADNHSVSSFVVHPVFIDRYIPSVATGYLGGAILDYIAELSRPMRTWTIRQPLADSSFIVMDTTAWSRSGVNYTDTLALTNRDSFAYSAPFYLRDDGYPVSVTLQGTAGGQYRVGRELLMWGNIEAEGATPWNLNSAYEKYDTVTFHAGRRSIGLNRSGGGSNSVSTNLVYRQVFPYGANCTMSGWVRGQNGNDIALQFEFWDARSGGHLIDSVLVAGPQDGTFGWTQYWRDLVDPQYGYCYDIKLRLLSPATGTGYANFDDLKLVQWENWHSGTTPMPFPSNIRYIQVRAPLGTASAVITYRKEWAVANLLPPAGSTHSE
jgi:poly-gamma-glutamate capsule biosynthesis protein CapA/YwtB (metallophosphatase superfamily)